MKKHYLGQVFLKNEQVLKKISKAIEINKKDIIFEIGGGKGALTKYLVKEAKEVIVCELDKKLLPFLRELNVTVINENILNVKIPRRVTKIVGNIPYYLSGKITEKILKEKKPCFILYQKEFARRIVSTYGLKSYSRLTVLAQTLAIPKILLQISRNDFKPVPKVDSSFVKFLPKNVDFDAKYFDFIKTIFKFKNKSLKNALICGRRDWTKEHDKRKLKPFFKDLIDKRVVVMPIEQLADEYKKFKNNKINN